MIFPVRPSISIIIPTLNEEKYIERCLKSLKNQSFRNFEIIVSDSYSTDDTVKIAKKYGAKVVLTKKLVQQLVEMKELEKQRGVY